MELFHLTYAICTQKFQKKKDGQIFATHLFNNSYLPFDLE